MKFQKFLAELQRRNVFRATLAYLAVAWLLVQIASIIFPAFNAPDYFLKILIYLLGIGLIVWIGFSWVYDLTPEGLKRSANVSWEEVAEGETTKKLNKVIIAATSLALLLVIAFGVATTANTVTEDPTKKVAVIPFSGIQEEQEDFFLTGMTENLIDELSKIDALLVINQSSTKLLKGSFDPSDILLSKKVKEVDYFITGSLANLNNKVEAKIELKLAIDEKAKWSKSYSEDISRVEFLWAKVAEDLSYQMEVVDGPVDAEIVSKLKSVNPETYELYLKGKHFLNKSKIEDWQRGIYYLEQAIEQNPADPNAYAGLAEGYITIGHSLNPPADVFPKALAAAKRAIQLDSTNAHGWAALAHYHTYFGWDWNLADYAFKKADKLNPNMAYNHYHRAWYLALFGKMNEAIKEHKYAQELDPFASLHTAWLAELYRWVGLYDEAFKEIEKASKMHDDEALSMFVKARVLIDLGKNEEALVEFRNAIAINSGYKYFGYPEALAQIGHTNEARKIIAEMEQLPESAFISGCLASTYFAMNELDEGFYWLEKNKGHAFYPWIRVMAHENVREDPRFLELIKELNLPDPSPLEFNPDDL